MKLQEYIDNLQALVKKNPEAADMDVFSADDDVGNYFNAIYCTPSVGHHDGCTFYSAEYLAEDDEAEGELNAVCVN